MTVSTHQFHLPTGHLTLQLDTPMPASLDAYLRVVARLNPKRGFLFVSHLLGKHVPTPMGRMRKGHDRLARLVAPTVSAGTGDVLVIGLAEAATGLGYGVWRSLAGQMHAEGRTAFFLQTTRHRAAGPAWAFEEHHSHAPTQWVQGLDDPRLGHVQHLVLVDDDLSTGDTLSGLQAVVQPHLPALRTAQWAALTDFRPDDRRRHPAHALLQGRWDFKLTKAYPSPSGNASNPVDPTKLQADFGRAAPLDWDGRKRQLTAARQWLVDQPIHGRVLVVGTGEFMALPMELAERIEALAGVDSVDFQTTTRSPAMMPGVPLGDDHYGEGIPQFIYNFDRDAYDSVVVVVETPPNPATERLGQLLKALVVGPSMASAELVP